MSRNPMQIEIQIEGAATILDIESDLSMGDLSEDMNAISGLIGWYGRVLALARRNLDEAADLHKRTSGRFLEDRLARDGKEAEWKARTSWEASKQFGDTRIAMARARETVGILDAAFTALQVKADILRSKGALSRSELATDSMSTPAEPRDQPRRSHPARDVSEEDRRAGIGEAMRRRREREKTDSDSD